MDPYPAYKHGETHMQVYQQHEQTSAVALAIITSPKKKGPKGPFSCFKLLTIKH